MNRPPIEQLLGGDDRDPGCDGAFEVLDQYVEAVRRGEDPRVRYAEFLAHIRSCAACREDTEGLLAALDLLHQSPPPTPGPEPGT
ncbi:MAG: hypothetical protein U0133_16195 [Gemmatimonadales bacterium]